MKSGPSGALQSTNELAARINTLDVNSTGSSDSGTGDDVLADEDLVLDDVQADTELGGEELLVEGDIRGLLSQRRLRVIITAKTLTEKPFDADHGDKAEDAPTVKLTCHFQAAANTRFVEAHVSLKINEPEAAVFLDVAPEQVKPAEGVTVTVNRNGIFNLMVGAPAWAPMQGQVSASLGRGVVAEYVQYTCELTGAGAATDEATWVFQEDDKARNGISNKKHVLYVSLPNAGTYRCQLTVNAAADCRGSLWNLKLAQTKEVTLKVLGALQ